MILKGYRMSLRVEPLYIGDHFFYALPDYDLFVSPEIVEDLTAVRGMLKRKGVSVLQTELLIMYHTWKKKETDNEGVSI